MIPMEAIHAVRVGGKLNKPGDLFEVGEDDAEALEAQGAARVAEHAVDDESPKLGNDAPPSAEARSELIAKAISELAAGDFNQGGLPKVAAVKKATGLDDVTAEELKSFKADGPAATSSGEGV